LGQEKEVTGEWKKLHNEELQCFYSSPNNIKENEIDGASGMYGGKK
jgi:hypothetical protein